MMNIDLSQYRLVQPTNIKKIKEKRTMYDITVKDNNTFFIFLSDYTQVLSHNCDGQHITSLIINFFYKWFPHIIDNKTLYKLITPLVSCDVGKERKYFYTLEDFNEYVKTNKVSNTKYLKGLGSLSLRDWQYVMENKMYFSIINDRSSKKFLDIAFGDNANRRKSWLAGK